MLQASASPSGGPATPSGSSSRRTSRSFGRSSPRLAASSASSSASRPPRPSWLSSSPSSSTSARSCSSGSGSSGRWAGASSTAPSSASASSPASRSTSPGAGCVRMPGAWRGGSWSAWSLGLVLSFNVSNDAAEWGAGLVEDQLRLDEHWAPTLVGLVVGGAHHRRRRPRPGLARALVVRLAPRRDHRRARGRRLRGCHPGLHALRQPGRRGRPRRHGRPSGLDHRGPPPGLPTWLRPGGPLCRPPAAGVDRGLRTARRTSPASSGRARSAR